ncbi:MAG: hypothetical protein ABI717_05500, partial [Actinomycetota bacterium]
IVLSVLADAAFIEAELGRLESARSSALECLSGENVLPYVRLLALVASELGLERELRAIAAEAPAEDRSAPPLRALLEGEFVAAADAWGAMEMLPLEAHARLRAAERFRAEGRHPEADEQLERALAFWRSVGATRYVRRGEALLAASA